MSETKWTLGPWKVCDEARVGGYAIEAAPSAYTHVTVAVSIQSEGCVHPLSSAEAENNARLIAAAPELYEALKKLSSFVVTDLVESCNGNKCCEPWCAGCFGEDTAQETIANARNAAAQARVALAKARGEA